jgi:HlyD family secretion protein
MVDPADPLAPPRRRVRSIALPVALALVAAYGLYLLWQPRPLPVDVATVARGDLLQTVDEVGRTRVRDRYTLSAPIEGRLLRTPLRAGDRVVAGKTVVAEFAARPAPLLDARTQAEREASIRRAEAAVAAAEARRSQAQAEANAAGAQAQRVRALRAGGAASEAELEHAERDDRVAAEGLRAAAFAVQVAEHERELARASRVPSALPDETPQAEPAPPPAPLALRSPIDGLVLRVHEESARALAAGAPILDVGDLRQLELVADFLTQDAVRVRPGMPVAVERFGALDAQGQPQRLQAVVQRVEPGGFTKVSALGVEEQRVAVVATPAGPTVDWQALGDGYRVELRVLVDERKDALRVPTGALFRRGEAWAAFVVRDGRAREVAVQVGRTTPGHAEVLGGLAAGDVVVLYPSELMVDGAAVRPQ